MYGYESYRDRQSLAERVATALKRRVGPGKAMTVKQLCHAINIGETTVWSLMSGHRDPSARVLERLIDFYDGSFIQEIFAANGCVIAKLSDVRAADAIRRLNQARADLIAALDGKEAAE